MIDRLLTVAIVGSLPEHGRVNFASIFGEVVYNDYGGMYCMCGSMPRFDDIKSKPFSDFLEVYDELC